MGALRISRGDHVSRAHREFNPAPQPDSCRLNVRLPFGNMAAIVLIALISIAIVAVQGFIAFKMAQRKGRSSYWALIGLLSPLGWLIGLAVLSGRKPIGAAADAEAQAREEVKVGTNECESCGYYNSPTADLCRKCRSPLRSPVGSPDVV